MAAQLGDKTVEALRPEPGTYCTVCGNRPSDGDDVALTAREAALLTVDLLRLCKAIAGPLGVRGRPEVIPDLSDVIRVGTVIPDPD